jgi:hypothetical protein
MILWQASCETWDDPDPEVSSRSLIGVFSSEALAHNAVAAAKELSNLDDARTEWTVSSIELNSTDWAAGFVEVSNG